VTRVDFGDETRVDFGAFGAAFAVFFAGFDLAFVFATVAP
jgi:hypothetical protein